MKRRTLQQASQMQKAQEELNKPNAQKLALRREKRISCRPRRPLMKN